MRERGRLIELSADRASCRREEGRWLRLVKCKTSNDELDEWRWEVGSRLVGNKGRDDKVVRGSPGLIISL